MISNKPLLTLFVRSSAGLSMQKPYFTGQTMQLDTV